MTAIMNAFHRHLAVRFLKNLILAWIILTATSLALAGGGPFDGSPAFFVSLLMKALPLALLVATLFTLGPMARNHEITALRTAGWSLARITWPIMVFGAAGSLLTMSGPPGGPPDPARPLLCIIAVLAGVAFGVTPRAATRYVGFLTALSLLFLYYFVTALFGALGRHGGLPPVVVGWGPTVLFGVASLVLFRQAEK